ncbi:radical SAM protein [Candidatus Shapirobacteria bacterium]|nr:MAG: radical SAM protein [Candidatus Shapirobacteria bacterium]
MNKIKVKKRRVKSAITKSGLPNADYVLNPYVGCQHGCIYCYADFMKRFTGHNGEDWGSFVDIKVNAPETITAKSVKKDSLILIGSVTDAYQAIEAKYKITRKCLERLLEFQPKLEILTKSPLILRDLDLLKKFENLRVGMSVGILDEKLAKQLEPQAPPPQKRLEALKILYQQGIKTYLFISPIFPEITDFKQLVKLVKNDVDQVLFENLNIRANNRKRIFEFLKRNKPELANLYEKIKKDGSYWNDLERKIAKYCRKNKIGYKIYFRHKTI